MTRPASIRSSIAQIGAFSRQDEVNASPKRPAAPGVHAARVDATRTALALMARPETATVAAWSACCMAGNVLEAMLQQGVAQDPDGLLQDAFDALKRAAQAVRAPGEPISLPPADFALVEAMVASWADLLLEAPARAVIKAFRATDRRIRDIEAGRLQPHDFTIEAAA